MKINKLIDHTLLKPASTREEIRTLCEEAKKYDFASVCVNTYWVPFCARELAGTDVRVCTVVGFPLGAMSTAAKAFEAAQAVRDGADEIDMVLNIGELKGKNDDAVKSDVEAVVDAAGKKIVKVILETCLLTDEEIVRACNLCVEAGAAFVKTSTGFSTAGADPRVVKLMKEAVNGRALVKAAGGVRTREDLEAMVRAGADRIGTSAGAALVAEA